MNDPFFPALPAIKFEISQTELMAGTNGEIERELAGRLTDDHTYVFHEFRGSEGLIQFVNIKPSAGKGLSKAALKTPVKVRKNYNSVYFERMVEYNLRSEWTWYRDRPICDMPVLLYRSRPTVQIVNQSLTVHGSGFIDMAYAGKPVQDFPSRKIVVPDEQMDSFYQWLVALRKELKSAKVYHRDIHGKNILMREDPTGKLEFSLIDWSWATTDPNAKMGPTGIGTDDRQIDAFLQAIDAYDPEMEPLMARRWNR